LVVVLIIARSVKMYCTEVKHDTEGTYPEHPDKKAFLTVLRDA
jgi:hypothetical protein